MSIASVWTANLLAVATLVACGPAAADHAPAPSAIVSSTPGSCFLLALGPAVESDKPPVTIPAVIELRSAGHLAGATSLDDTLAALEPDLGSAWERRPADSLLVAWSPIWLSGSLYLKLTSRGDTLRGRYEMHHHQDDDGRLLWRGDALALRAQCSDSRAGGRQLADGAALDDRVRALARWRTAQRPDTTAAVAEALQAFENFLKKIPIHSISLFNYRLAEYACRQGKLPGSIDELRAAASPPKATAFIPLEERSWRDAWGRPLLFQHRGARGYEVRSAGPDGIAHTADDLVGAYDEAPLKRERKDNCE